MRVKVVELRMLRRCGVVTRIVLGSRLNRTSNDYIRKSLGVTNITEKIGENKFRRFGYEKK